jgi:hypothetical protein
MTKKKPAKRQKRVFYPAEMEGAVTGEEGFESGSENLEMSPNLLDESTTSREGLLCNVYLSNT